MLPKAIEELIFFYLGRFEVAASRPSLRAVRRLVRKSNRNIARRYLLELYPEFPITAMSSAALFFTHDFNINLTEIFQQPNTIMCFFNALVQSTTHCMSTSGIRWLLTKDLLCVPPYRDILMKSYFVQMIHLPYPLGQTR